MRKSVDALMSRARRQLLISIAYARRLPNSVLLRSSAACLDTKY